MVNQMSLIKFVKGDITKLKVDIIVNAANSYLKHGGGVAGAIVRAGGSIIQKESDDIVMKRGPIKVGEVVFTSAGKLNAKHIIHAVGPRNGEGKEEEKLRKATLNSLYLAESLSAKSIAFPAISTGVFGYPKEKCALVMLSAVKEYFEKGGKIKDITFCLYDDETYNVFVSTYQKIFEIGKRTFNNE
ncbi:MAG: macro domain-containing protein [Candidatus Brockarchaeota archaeon]|nr:macro domain-containing protein [Candidatus Brockarchaeota archaeon]